MPITFQCKSCQTSYTVKDTLAGRTAECRHCGQRFQIPYRSPVVKLDDDMIEEGPPPSRASLTGTATRAGTRAGAAHGTARGGVFDEGEEGADGLRTDRSFAEYEPLRKPGKRKKEAAPDEPFVPLPSVLNDVWLPIAMCVIFYGASLYMVCGYVFRSYGVGAGLHIAGLTALLYWAAVLPLTVRLVEGAAASFGFTPSNALFLQTAAAMSLPVWGILLGMFKNGMSAAVTGGLITLVLAMAALAVMFQTSVGKAIQTAIMAALGFGVSAIVTVGFVWLVSVNLIPRWGLNLPWVVPPPPETVVKKTEPTVEAAPLQAPAVPLAGTGTGLDSGAPAEGLAALRFTPLQSGGEAVQVISARVGAGIADALRNAKVPAPKVKPKPLQPIEVVAKQKQWTVRVAAVQREDAGDAELADLKQQLGEAQQVARKARDAANDLEDDKVTAVGRDALGNRRTVVRNKNSKSALGAARTEALRAESAVRLLQGKIAKVETERKKSLNERVVVGRLDDGRVVQIKADGAALAALADRMAPDSVWHVQGTGRVAGGQLAVKPSAFTAISGSLAPAPTAAPPGGIAAPSRAAPAPEQRPAPGTAQRPTQPPARAAEPRSAPVMVPPPAAGLFTE